MDISEMADKAADYIEEHGWCKGSLRNREGRVCLRGALFVVNETLAGLHGLDKEREANCYVTESAIRDYVNAKTIPDWNDFVAQSQDEVVTVLREVATKYRSDEMNVSGNEAQR